MNTILRTVRFADPEKLPDDAPGGDCEIHGPYSGSSCPSCGK